MPAEPARAKYLRALAVLVLCTGLAAFLGALASIRAPDFYQQIAKPAWAPPAGVFGPVWSILYAAMAIAAWLVVAALGWPRARGPMMLYGLQLALNAVWSWLFFRWRLGGAAFIDVLALLAVLLFTVRAFWRARPLAGALMLPYLAWVAFAAALTYAVWQRNPNVL